ncbi:MAG: hypothetical protein AB1815_04375 [Bacillota bacterium]|jgi:hypothetical protein
MQWHGFRVPIIILALILGLGAFVGVQWLYNKYNFLQPLEDYLAGSPAVKTYKIDDLGDTLLLTVELGETGNLASDYQDLQHALAGILGKRPFALQLTDNRDQVLQQAYYESQFAIYEALARGNYREMADVVHDNAAEAGAEVAIFLDGENIYVYMERNGRRLTEVIPLPDGSTTNSAVRTDRGE